MGNQDHCGAHAFLISALLMHYTSQSALRYRCILNRILRHCSTSFCNMNSVSGVFALKIPTSRREFKYTDAALIQQKRKKRNKSSGMLDTSCTQWSQLCWLWMNIYIYFQDCQWHSGGQDFLQMVKGNIDIKKFILTDSKASVVTCTCVWCHLPSTGKLLIFPAS